MFPSTKLFLFVFLTASSIAARPVGVTEDSRKILQDVGSSLGGGLGLSEGIATGRGALAPVPGVVTRAASQPQAPVANAVDNFRRCEDGCKRPYRHRKTCKHRKNGGGRVEGFGAGTFVGRVGVVVPNEVKEDRKRKDRDEHKGESPLGGGGGHYERAKKKYEHEKRSYATGDGWHHHTVRRSVGGDGWHYLNKRGDGWHLPFDEGVDEGRFNGDLELARAGGVGLLM